MLLAFASCDRLTSSTFVQMSTALVMCRASQGRRSARIEAGCLVEGTAIPTRDGMRLASLLLYFFLALTNTFVPTVLRGKCLSVDEPIQGSTPALAILGSLITPTPKCSLIIGVFGTIAVSGRCTVLRAGCPRSQLASNTDTHKVRHVHSSPDCPRSKFANKPMINKVRHAHNKKCF